MADFDHVTSVNEGVEPGSFDLAIDPRWSVGD